MQNDNLTLRKLESSQWEVEAGGLRNLPWKPDADNPLAPPVLDFNWLVAQPLLPVLVQVVPAHVLYRSLMSHGLEDSIEVLEWVRGDQLARVLDFDVWTESSEHGAPEILADRVLDWVRAWLDIGPEFAAARLIELDEETIISVVTALFEILPEGISANEDSVSDDYFLTPDRRFYLRSRAGGEEGFEISEQLMRALYGQNARLASVVFAHSAMLVRQESLEDAVRVRRGRLADQGFVEAHEARSMLRARPIAKQEGEIRAHVRRERSASLVEEERKRKFAKTHAAFMADIEPETFDAVVNLFRAMDPDEGYRYVTALLPESEVRLLTGTSQPSADSAMDDDSLLEELTERAVLASRALLSRAYAGNLPAEGSSRAGAGSRGTLLIERAIAALAESATEDAAPDSASLSVVLDLKSRIARVSNAFSAAVSPGDFLTGETFDRALGVTRGCLNIGLELALRDPLSYGLEADTEGFEESRAGEALRLIGPEFLFQLGWQRLLGASSAFASALVELERAKPAAFGFLATVRHVALDDGKSLHLALDALVETGRFVDVRKWQSGVEEHVPAPTAWVLNAILNRVPLFPEAFESQHRGLRPFAHLSELSVVEKFLSHLEANLLAP